MEVTYIPMAKGFLYLVVIMDWVSRAVLAWRLGAEFCVEALEEAQAPYSAEKTGLSQPSDRRPPPPRERVVVPRHVLALAAAAGW